MALNKLWLQRYQYSDNTKKKLLAPYEEHTLLSVLHHPSLLSASKISINMRYWSNARPPFTTLHIDTRLDYLYYYLSSHHEVFPHNTHPMGAGSKNINITCMFASILGEYDNQYTVKTGKKSPKYTMME